MKQSIIICGVRFTANGLTGDNNLHLIDTMKEQDKTKINQQCHLIQKNLKTNPVLKDLLCKIQLRTA